MCGVDEDRALDLVEAAWMAGIVDESQDGFGHFRFAHELVREALVDDLSALRRMRLHHRIGEAIEELHGERNPGFLTERADHFVEAMPAGDALKAVLYNQRAADRLNAELAYEDAIPTYERANQLGDTYDAGSWQTHTDLLIGLGWAMRATGRLGDARRCAPPRHGPRPQRRRSREDRARSWASAGVASGAGGTSSVSSTSISSPISNVRSTRSRMTTRCCAASCSRLSVEGYFAFSRRATRGVER